ncbi:MAG: hypothetical protein AAF791_15400, partial [Bacteroidota bacterium]
MTPPHTRYSIEATDPETGETLRLSVSCTKPADAKLVDALKALAIAAAKAIRDGAIEDESIYADEEPVTEADPYARGRDDFDLHGKWSMDNPYPTGSAAHEDWLRGWNHALS